MRKTIRISELPVFDMAEHLEDDQAIAEYLSIVLEDIDPPLLAAALGDVARARGMNEIARAAGIDRKALYQALRPGAHSPFETIQRICGALGVKLTAMRVW